MGKLKYILYTIAAAMIAAANSIKASADNVPAALDADADGVIDGPSGSTGTEVVNTTPPAVDGTGLPWDERIHSGGKSIKVDGTWTKKKGATPPVVAAVEAELRARAGTAVTTGAQLGVQLPAIGGLVLPGVKLTNYQQLVAYLAAKTGPGKAADDAWVNSAFASLNMSLPALATDETNSALALAEFKKVLGE